MTNSKVTNENTPAVLNPTSLFRSDDSRGFDWPPGQVTTAVSVNRP